MKKILGVMKFLSMTSLVLVVLLLGTQATSHAALTLRLDDGGGNSVLVADGNADGVVTYNGAVGPVWTINVTTGLSKPALGSAANPRMDLNSVNVSSTAGGTMHITLVDDGFTGGASPFNFLIGGTTDGTVTADAIYDDGNTTNPVNFTTFASLGPFGTGAFSGSTTGGVSVTPPFSLGIDAYITHALAGQSSSFNASLAPVPVPGAFLLLGAGLFRLAAYGRRRRNQV